MAGMTIARQSMVQQVRDAVIELLRKEEYTPGRYIPSEQELADLFEASRATVRGMLPIGSVGIGIFLFRGSRV